MPGLSTQATATTTQTISLRPSLRKQLLTKLGEYQQMHTQAKTLKAAMDAKKAEIGKLRNETGEQSLSLEGFTVTLVAPLKKWFDAKYFVSLGGSLSILNQATKHKPAKTYEKITCPGVEDDPTDDE
jgi:hypothetical protein